MKTKTLVVRITAIGKPDSWYVERHLLINKRATIEIPDSTEETFNANLVVPSSWQEGFYKGYVRLNKPCPYRKGVMQNTFFIAFKYAIIKELT